MDSPSIAKYLIFFGMVLLLTSLLIALPLSANCKDIKIGLITTDKSAIIGSNKNGILVNSFTNNLIAKISKQELYKIENVNGLIRITDKSKKTFGAFRGPIKLIPERKDGFVSCNNHWYRGELLLLTNGDKKILTVVNNVDLEDYLFSVVSSEIPSNWNKEALKAQSVAARSYSLGYLGRRIEKGYDLESSVEDQVYLGIASEKKSTTQAVRETKGIALVDKDNKPLIALYHSSGGGYTDSIENIWDKKPSEHISEYIKPRPDYDDNSPHFKWFRNYKISKLNTLLASLNIGEITNIAPLSRSISNRIMWIKITGTKGTAVIRGEEFRKFLKLPSSKFNLKVESNTVKLAGRGYGHGLGMSQWGAKALAEHGFTYEQILAHYYTGARLTKIEDVK